MLTSTPREIWHEFNNKLISPILTKSLVSGTAMSHFTNKAHHFSLQCKQRSLHKFGKRYITCMDITGKITGHHNTTTTGTLQIVYNIFKRGLAGDNLSNEWKISYILNLLEML